MVQTRMTGYLHISMDSQSGDPNVSGAAPCPEDNITPGQQAKKASGKSKKSKRNIKNQQKRAKSVKRSYTVRTVKKCPDK